MEKQRWEESEKRREEERRSEKRKSQKKEDAGARKGRKAVIHCVFSNGLCGSGGSTSRLAKRQVQSHLARWEMKNCTPWREAHFEVNMCNTHRHRSTFGSWDVEKARAVVARGTFGSPKCKKLMVSDHFWKLRCWKSARRCGEKHVSKSKWPKHTRFGAISWSWDVEKVHAVLAGSTLRSQNVKSTHARPTFGRSDVVSCGRRKGLCTLSKVSKTGRFFSSFNYNHHYTTLHSTALQLRPPLQLQYVTLHYTNNITLRYTTLHYTTLHYIRLHYTTLNYTTLNCTTFNYTTLHCSYNYNYNYNYIT